MAKDMSNNDIVAYEGGDYGEIMDNYDLHEITAAIANRAGKAADTVKSLEQEIEDMKDNPDVVDIINSYADLQAYDTSKLSDKDIIRVLSDETHDGESTYYRWSATAQSWTYIGESKQYTDFVGTDGTTAGTNGLVPAPATTDAGKFLKADGTWDDAGSAVNVVQTTGTSITDVMSQKAVTDALATAGPTVVQTTGTSTTDVMSQNATSRMVFADPTTKFAVQIGNGASADLNAGVAIGSNATSSKSHAIAIKGTASGLNGVAIGNNASAPTAGSIAIGPYSGGNSIAAAGVMHIGSSNTNLGYNNSKYRLLTGLYDPQSAHDAATKGYVDTAVAGAGANTISSQDWSDLWQQMTIQYMG